MVHPMIRNPRTGVEIQDEEIAKHRDRINPPQRQFDSTVGDTTVQRDRKIIGSGRPGKNDQSRVDHKKGRGAH